MAQTKIRKEQVEGEVVLYNDTTGTNGNVTLSETAANFTYLEIFYKSNDPAYNSCKVFAPDGKSASLIIIRYSGGAVYHKTKRASISGTTITSNDNSEYYFTNSSTATVNTNNNINIVRVVGYR